MGIPMKIVPCLMILLAGVSWAEMKPLPTEGEGWHGDPVVWRFRADGVHVTSSNGNGIAVYEAAPLASNVAVEAVFVPRAAARLGWGVASVAIVEDARNYWHLALVQSPPEEGCKPRLELVEMREGNWLAQGNLKQEAHEESARTWSFGEAYRLTLALDHEGITGVVAARDGDLLMRRRFAFSGPAVTRGRPALRVAGFTGSFTEVRAAWDGAVAGRPAKAAHPAYAMENVVPQIADRATGFFHVVKKPDGRWWAIDPLGRGVVLLGVDHVTFQGHWCEKLGYPPHGRKNAKKYADRAEWESETLGRLKAWGFTMLGAGCDPKLKHRGLVHTEFLNIGSHLATLGDEYDITPNEGRPCSAFPNVFHPDFEAFCRYRARQLCAPGREDPWLFGYFIDNELAWWGRGGSDTGLFDAVMGKEARHAAKVALRDYVRGRCDGKIEEFNASFGTRLKGFDELLALKSLAHPTPGARELKKAFLAHVADRYFDVTSRAIRAADTNHLVLGARFAGTGGADPVVWEVSGKYCDVVTFNCYPMVDLDEGRVYTRFGKGGELVTDHFAKYHDYVKRPMLITEWSFPALDAGLPSVRGAGQRFRTQAERTEATSLFARTMLSLPFLLGYDYFMWVDEPALGISTAFPEDSNYGLINEDGVPYAQLTAMFEALHRDAGGWRFKPAPPPRERPTGGSRPGAMAIAQRAAVGDKPAFFVREGEAFRAGNGRIGLSGRLGDGNLVRRVTLDGADQVFGQYNALVQTIDAGGQNRWTDASAVQAVQGCVTGGVAVVEITGAAARGQESFEVTHRLLLPPGAPWFVSEIVSVKNSGLAPLRLKGLFFRLFSEFRDVPQGLPPNLWGMPVADCWLDGSNGRFFGAVASGASDIRIDFWLDEATKAPHPDARWEMDETVVAPGATFAPAEAVYVLCVAGAGGPAAWINTAQELRKALE